MDHKEVLTRNTPHPRLNPCLIEMIGCYSVIVDHGGLSANDFFFNHQEQSHQISRSQLACEQSKSCLVLCLRRGPCVGGSGAQDSDRGGTGEGKPTAARSQCPPAALDRARATDPAHTDCLRDSVQKAGLTPW